MEEYNPNLALLGALQRLVDLSPEIDIGGDDESMPAHYKPSLEFFWGTGGCEMKNFRDYEVAIGNQLLERLLHKMVNKSKRDRFGI